MVLERGSKRREHSLYCFKQEYFPPANIILERFLTMKLIAATGLFVLLLDFLSSWSAVAAFVVGLAPPARKTTTTTTRFSSSVFRLASSSPNNEEENDEEDDAVATGIGATNVLGTALQPCCNDVGGSGIGTGFYRNGYCATGSEDMGRHTVCVQVTDEFLAFSKAVGNDLSTPMPQYLFPGLKENDIWCLCAERWVQAYEYGAAPKLMLQSTHEKTLTYTTFEILRAHALDGDEADKSLSDLNEQRDQLNKLL